MEPVSQHGVDASTVRTDGMNVLEVRFPFSEALHLSHRIRHDRDGDAVDPGAERRVAPELRELRERSNERVLRELAGQIRVARQTEGESKDPRRVRVIE